MNRDIATFAMAVCAIEGCEDEAGAVKDLIQIRDLADKFFEQVLPQAGKLVLDIGVANELGILLRKYKE